MILIYIYIYILIVVGFLYSVMHPMNNENKNDQNCKKLEYFDISQSYRAVVPNYRDTDLQCYWYRAAIFNFVPKES